MKDNTSLRNKRQNLLYSAPVYANIGPCTRPEVLKHHPRISCENNSQPGSLWSTTVIHNLNKMAQTVELNQLQIPHLEALRGQLEEEVKMLSDSMGQLKIAQQKFKDSKENVVKMANQDTGMAERLTLMVRYCMYVPGTLEDIKSVMVDIGTGYFAEKDLKEAELYFQRKMDYVTTQIEKLQPLLIEKHKMRQGECYPYCKTQDETR
ncbi:hypothetical protein QZH41_019773 [Actinostola sp. cb2023]|nr:hypothetical protein QZH41_019773 [Actinostola sp. cb2023]